jgi:hypothetical protein
VKDHLEMIVRPMGEIIGKRGERNFGNRKDGELVSCPSNPLNPLIRNGIESNGGESMDILKAFLFSICISASTVAVCQQQPMPDKLSPKIGYLQCRADAQKWTTDPFDTKDARNLTTNTAIMVNGQLRSIPAITPHVTVSGLMNRAYEMSVCIHEDAEFEKQFATYSALSNAYQDERNFRYIRFVMKHNLNGQFIKEDAEENK